MIEIKRKELSSVKLSLLEAQDFVCPISKLPLSYDKEAVVDHQHKLFKDEKLGENGAGMIRGVLDFRANAFEGKCFRAYRRLGLHKIIPLPELLRNVASYLESSPTNMIHPNEVPKEKKLGKRAFNKIAKLYGKDHPNKKPLVYPKSEKPTNQIKSLAKEYGVEL